MSDYCRRSADEQEGDLTERCLVAGQLVKTLSVSKISQRSVVRVSPNYGVSVSGVEILKIPSEAVTFTVVVLLTTGTICVNEAL
jgi:hypothetical protein